MIHHVSALISNFAFYQITSVSFVDVTLIVILKIKILVIVTTFLTIHRVING